ncbi:uncharacterized protein N7518_001079 [Penicillium psychrosexuale]|uniref:uncharacterized protein n=1 Tax=Penicillium psychrosexuale TaxID=1002107 RepID=UPI002545201E|nr:uncharacterized protein N7518_001079 [Penicillium psychrosexuale]KAJ5804776.1 hypothetical protein N7518_001079 [Penicillium psychrosexuale]
MKVLGTGYTDNWIASALYIRILTYQNTSRGFLQKGSDTPTVLTNTSKGETQNLASRSIVYGNSLAQNTTDLLVSSDGVSNSIASADLWSAAYREAVEMFGKELDIADMKGKNVMQLFHDLEVTGKEKVHESAFLRGLNYLRAHKIYLEGFKLALDLSSPLANMEPATNAAFGVVRSVTAIAISFATADLDFAKQIVAMLKQIAYIDDCDTLGQKADRNDIHKALVSVYQKILEFYEAALEILKRTGARFIMKMVLENDRLPTIVQEFLECSQNLTKIISKATCEIQTDIQRMLYDRESKSSYISRCYTHSYLIQVSRWLGGDKMSQQTQYHQYLTEQRADKACEFLLENPNFINWYRASDSQQLMIFGDMGSGKSFAMAFLADELVRRSKHQLPQPKVCYYYCRDDETGKTVFILSALILSLLGQLTGLKKPFVQWYKEAQNSGDFDPATNFKTLGEFLCKVLEAIDRPVFVVIDGLDECNRESRSNLLTILRKLLQRVSGLKIILSSRTQDEILERLHDTAKIEMVTDAHRDGIIVAKVVERKLFDLSPNVKSLVIDRLTRLAKGSAIWTRMTIELIETRKIMAFDPMKSFLEEMSLPEQLSEVYSTLLSRCSSNDPDNLKIASTALKILATTNRNLSILELGWAVALGTTRHVTTVDALAKLVDHQRVMRLIHPFIAHVEFKDVKKHQVRLVHQSVKEFVLKNFVSNQPWRHGPISREPDEMILDQCSESLQAFILDICTRYLLLEDIGRRTLFSEDLVAIAELPQDIFNDNEGPIEYDKNCTWEAWEEDMIHFDPTDRGFGEFFVYASCHWLNHFCTITAEHLPSLETIEKICQAGSTRLSNWIQQNCRPGCTLTPRFEFESSLYDPLSIASLYGSVAMLRDMLENSSFDKDIFLEQSAMRAAHEILRWGDVSRLGIIFFSDRLGHQLRNLDFFRLIIKWWCNRTLTNHQCDLVFDLVNDVSNQLVQEQWGNELLCIAASAGCMPIIRRLMTSAQHSPELKSELLRGYRLEQWSQVVKPTHQSIGEAVLRNNLDVVQYLLGESGIEALLRYRNSRGENVLHLASKTCNPDIFRLLALHFQEGIHQEDDQGDTALVRIITSSSPTKDRYESAKILLSHYDTDWNFHSWNEQHNALRAAVKICDLGMCCLLICIGKINALPSMTCDSVSQVDLENIRVENEGNMLEILADLFEIMKVLPNDDSAQLFGPMTERSIRKLAEDRFNSDFGDLISGLHPVEVVCRTHKSHQ